MKFESVFKSMYKNDPLVAYARNKKFPYEYGVWLGEGFRIDIGNGIESNVSCTCLELKDKVDSLIGGRNKLSVPLRFMLYPYNNQLRRALGMVFEGYDIGFNFQ